MSESEAAAWGLTIEEASPPPVEIWPDNASAVNVFSAMNTQWRIGMKGATGLDYSALPAVMRLCGVATQDRMAVFESVRVMEDAALTFFRESK